MTSSTINYTIIQTDVLYIRFLLHRIVPLQAKNFVRKKVEKMWNNIIVYWNNEWTLWRDVTKSESQQLFWKSDRYLNKNKHTELY